MISGLARVVSSVTYYTGSPWLTANDTASSVICSNFSSVQSSAKNRTEDEPMKVHASIGIPARCEISTMGTMSLRCVRAAQLGLILSFLSAISRANRSTPAACVPPAPEAGA